MSRVFWVICGLCGVAATGLGVLGVGASHPAPFVFAGVFGALTLLFGVLAWWQRRRWTSRL